MARCTCPGGDHDPCAFCAGFESWSDRLTEDQLAEFALNFVDSTPELSRQFDAFLAEQYGPVHERGEDQDAEARDAAREFMGALHGLTGYRSAA